VISGRFLSNTLYNNGILFLVRENEEAIEEELMDENGDNEEEEVVRRRRKGRRRKRRKKNRTRKKTETSLSINGKNILLLLIYLPRSIRSIFK